MKRKAYDTFVKCIAKHDELKFAKDNNGAKVKLDKKEINIKCNLLNRLAIMSKDVELMGAESEDQNDESAESNLSPQMQSQVSQVYYLLRTELAYREDNNDKDMADRYKQELDSLKRTIDDEAYERGNTKFVNFLEDEGQGVAGQGRTAAV